MDLQEKHSGNYEIHKIFNTEIHRVYCEFNAAFEVTEKNLISFDFAVSNKDSAMNSVNLCFTLFFLCVKILHASKASMHQQDQRDQREKKQNCITAEQIIVS